jgi:preprotein translocase subunit Sec63
MQPKTELDPYLVLGIDRDAGETEIRTAYRDLVARYHPDKHQGNPLEGLAAEKMAEINRAYEILSNPDRRADYDRSRGTWPRATGPGWGGGTNVPSSQRRRRRWLLLLGIILLLPLLIRIVAMLVRAVARIFRGGAGVLAAARGTPLLGVVVVVALLLLVFFLVRRRRRSQGSRKRER